MKKAIPLICVIAFIAIIFSCKHELPVGGGDTNNPPNGDHPCSADTVYFTKDILPLLLQNCAKSGCHDEDTAAAEVIMNNYQNIITTGEVQPGNPASSKLYTIVIEPDPGNIMPPPPAAPLTAAQIAMINKWISQGAKNNSCGESCDTTQFTYSGTISSIIQINCIITTTNTIK